MMKTIRGYSDVGEERLNMHMGPDKKETFDFGMPIRGGQEGATLLGPNLWPESKRIGKDFQKVCMEYLHAVYALSTVLLQAIAVGLGLPATHFDALMTEPLVVTRLLQYPPQWVNNLSGGGESKEPVESMGAGSHVDYGFLTLVADDRQGLEVIGRRGDSQWQGVLHVEGSFIVNTGFVLEKLTNGLLPATRHRVINRNSQHRRAVAFFLDPTPSATIGPLPEFVSGERPAQYQPCVAGHKGVRFGDSKYKRLRVS